MRNPVVCLPALAAIALSGCVTAEQPGGLAPVDEIVLDVRKTETAGGCTVQVFATYPNDLAPQTRELTISDPTSSLITQSGTAELPRPANDPRPVDNLDGTSSHTMFQWSFSPCRPVPLLIEIGACQSGECPPMRVAGDWPDGVEVTVAE